MFTFIEVFVYTSRAMPCLGGNQSLAADTTVVIGGNPNEHHERQPSSKMPRALRYQPDLARPGTFQIVCGDGVIWAEGVRNEAAARVFAASPGLLLGYDWMLEEVLEYFHVRWNIGYSGPDFHEFVEDEGGLEERYPGAPAHAEWLQVLRERSSDAKGPDGESPFEPFVDPQAELF